MEQDPHTGEGLVQPKFDQVKGGFHQPLGLKNTILRGSRGDPMKGQGQNMLLVTDTGSGLYNKAFYKAQS